ncbi:MAG: hypothetical protein QM770_10850 [Tepidisphaeraceae bacterium]
MELAELLPNVVGRIGKNQIDGFIRDSVREYIESITPVQTGRCASSEQTTEDVVSIDRLPRNVRPEHWYLNVLSSVPPRHPRDCPRGKVPAIVFDGANCLEVAALVERCRGRRAEVVVLCPPTVTHIGVDALANTIIDGPAYLRDRRSNRYVPTDLMLDDVRRHLVGKQKRVRIVVDR